MSWFKIDDGWWAHPKTLALSPQAIALWTRAGSWSSQQLTDGFISTSTLRLFGYKPGATRELVEVGYWDEVSNGYQFHDWGEYQPKGEDVRKKRETARERMRKVRAHKQGTLLEVPPTPTRPDPTRPEKSKDPSGSRQRSRAVALPADFEVTEAMKSWAKEKAPGIDLGYETEKFRNFHTSKGSTFKDWQAAWRTWITKAVEYNRSRPAAFAGRPSQEFD